MFDTWTCLLELFSALLSPVFTRAGALSTTMYAGKWQKAV